MLLVRSLSLLAFALLLSACDSGPRGAGVKGKVSLDDQPIDSGTINFIAKDGKNQSASTQIKNGQYEFTAKDGPAPGNYAIEVHWPKKTGKKVRVDAAIEGDEIKEAIPAKFFGKDTTLTAEIKSTGNTVVDFNLKSK